MTNRIPKAGFVSFMAAVLLAVLHGGGRCEPLTLSDGLRLAADQNRLVKMALHEEEVSKDDTLIARSGMLPSVNAFFAGTALAYQPQAIFGRQTVPLSEKDFFEGNLSVRQTLYDFGLSSSRYDASMSTLEMKRLDTGRVKNAVAAGFALAYFNLLEAQKGFVLAEKEAERLEAHLRDAKGLYEEGAITRNDLLQAEVRLSDARQRLLAAGTLRSVAGSRVNNLLARPLSYEVEAVEVSDCRLGEETGLEEAWRLALEGRPEMKMYDTALKALQFEEAAKRAEYFPQVFVQGAYDFAENRYQVHESNWALTLGMSVNLFGGGKTTAEVQKIIHRRARLEEEKRRTGEEIRMEVERYFLDLKTARERVDVTTDAVAQAEENLRINKLRYEEGVGTATEVIDAVTLLTTAGTNYSRAVHDLRRAEAGFLYAIGTDLTEVYH